MSHRDDLKRQIETHRRRLQKLREQKALLGIDTPPHILIEIEDIEVEIEAGQFCLARLEEISLANPYRGLAAFREQDAPFFFGREIFTAQLAEKVKQQPLVAVLGPSGSGKSSIVFAGLVPRLREEGGWLVADFRPKDRPVRSLAAALLPLLEPDKSETERLVEIRKMSQALDQGDLELGEVVVRILEKNPEANRLLLIADQFEELYTLCQEAETRFRFLDLLLQAIPLAAPAPDSAGSLHLVWTLRVDFLGQALAYRPLTDALGAADVKLGPMTAEELRQVIEKPAQKQGVSFEAGLVERILADVGREPGNLPLLEFALTALWEQQIRGELTHQAYEAIGQVKGALSGHAEAVFAGLGEAEQAQARRILVQLVHPGQGTEDTRRLAHRDELKEIDWPLVQQLASQRLVVTDRDLEERETVEIIHEALIRNWAQLRRWINEDRRFRIWQERLRAALRQWQISEQDEGALLRGVPLGR